MSIKVNNFKSIANRNLDKIKKQFQMRNYKAGLSKNNIFGREKISVKK